MKTKVMTRQDEIEVLQSLKGDTYFSQFFGQDIDQMCQNISNDFCIELGCSFNKATEVLAKQLKEAKAEKDEAVKSANHPIFSETDFSKIHLVEFH